MRRSCDAASDIAGRPEAEAESGPVSCCGNLRPRWNLQFCSFGVLRDFLHQFTRRTSTHLGAPLGFLEPREWDPRRHLWAELGCHTVVNSTELAAGFNEEDWAPTEGDIGAAGQVYALTPVQPVLVRGKQRHLNAFFNAGYHFVHNKFAKAMVWKGKPVK